MTRSVLLTILIGILLLLFIACDDAAPEGDAALGADEEVSGPAPAVEESYQPVHTGEVVLREQCQSCHGGELIMNLRGQDADWEVLVGSMEEKGAVLTEDEHFYLVEYLEWKDL